MGGGATAMMSLCCTLQMLFDVIVDNYDNIVPGSDQVSLYSGKIYKDPIIKHCGLFTDSSWMVTCTPRRDLQCANCPDKCYLDMLNIVYINSSNSSTTTVDMPWVNRNFILALNNSYYPPQRVLFDLPFIYYIKLVFYLMSING